MRPKAKTTMDTTTDRSDTGTRSTLTAGAITAVAVGLVTGVSAVVLFVLLLTRFKAVLGRCCRWQRSDDGSKSLVSKTLPNCRNTPRIQVDVVPDDLARMRVINETKRSPDDKERREKGAPDEKTAFPEDNNNYNDPAASISWSDKLSAVNGSVHTKSCASLNSTSSDIEVCRDGRSLDLTRLYSVSLSNLPDIFQDMIDGKLREGSLWIEPPSEHASTLCDGSLLPMTPDQHGGAEATQDNESSSDYPEWPRRPMPTNGSGENDLTIVTLESQVTYDEPVITLTEADGSETHSTHNNEVMAEEEVERHSVGPPIRLETYPVKSQEAAPDEELDYESFLSSLHQGHSMLIQEDDDDDACFLNTCTEEVDDRPPSCDDQKCSSIISTPCKAAADTINKSNREQRAAADGSLNEEVISKNSISPTVVKAKVIRGPLMTSDRGQLSSDTDNDDDKQAELGQNDINSMLILPAPVQYAGVLKDVNCKEISHSKANQTSDTLDSYCNITLSSEKETQHKESPLKETEQSFNTKNINNIRKQLIEADQNTEALLDHDDCYPVLILPAPDEYSGIVNDDATAAAAGNHTHELLQSYINITITSEGPLEKAPEPKSTPEQGKRLSKSEREALCLEISPPLSVENKTGLCKSDLHISWHESPVSKEGDVQGIITIPGQTPMKSSKGEPQSDSSSSDDDKTIDAVSFVDAVTPAVRHTTT